MKLDVLILNTSEGGGGASKVALTLVKFLIKNGHNSIFLVKKKKSDDTCTEQLHTSNRFVTLLHRYLSLIHRLFGLEYFPYLQSKRLNKFIGQKTILHLHNIHGDLFDINYINTLPKTVPVIITLHDSWYYTGHCAHHFDCKNWLYSGCSPCKYLKTPPRIVMDGARYNQAYKLNALKNSKAVLVAPSNWLMSELNQLQELAHLEKVLIHPGIDLQSFFPASRSHYESTVLDANMPFTIISTASSIDKNQFKYFDLALEAVRNASLNTNRKIIFKCIGSSQHGFVEGNLEVIFIPFSSQSAVAELMRDAHIFLHMARGETFGLVIIEAMASGLPVIASNIGGIPDSVIDNFNGYLVQNRADDVVDKILHLMNSSQTLLRLSKNAILTASNFSDTQMCNKYLELYQRLQPC